MSDTQVAVPKGTVCVERDGPRGWHFIDAEKFDSKQHKEVKNPKLPAEKDGESKGETEKE